MSWILLDEDPNATLHLPARTIEDTTLRILAPPLFGLKSLMYSRWPSDDAVLISHM